MKGRRGCCLWFLKMLVMVGLWVSSPAAHSKDPGILLYIEELYTSFINTCKDYYHKELYPLLSREDGVLLQLKDYLSTKTVDDQKGCWRYGTHPLVAKRVLIVFTSLHCPTCQKFHKERIPLLKAQSIHNPYSIVCVDYPGDPISLRMSSLLWSFDTQKMLEHCFPRLLERFHTFSQTLFQEVSQDSQKILNKPQEWMTETWWRLQQEKRTILQEDGGLPSRDALAIQSCEREFTGEALCEDIFNRRQGCKERLHMDSIPKAFLVLPPETKDGSWTYSIVEDVLSFQF